MSSSGNSGRSSVREFFERKTIFITGGTGFIGKVLVEKLLRSCPGILKIYLLVRCEGKRTKEQRMEELLLSPVFNRLRKENPNSLGKITIIRGDITLPHLGLTHQNKETLQNEVNIVFHNVASVKLVQPLDTSVRVNIIGTQTLVNLCRSMKNLEVLVHVSTAYSNCTRHEIGEIVYTPTVPPDDVIKLIENCNGNPSTQINDDIIGEYPNTYTFTKGIIEYWLTQNQHDLPLVILRPSIVVSCMEEPMKGWLDSWGGPTGLVAGASMGILRCLPVVRGKVADLVPVDMVVSLMIATAWHMGTKNDNALEVYNCCSGGQNPIFWHEFSNFIWKYNVKHPFAKVFWYPNRFETSSDILLSLYEGIFHWTPALIADCILIAIRNKPICLSIQKRLTKGIHAITYFVRNDWKFDNQNVKNLRKKLNESDQKEFNFDVTSIIWAKYIEEYCLGVRRYLLKEDDSSLPKARANIKRLYWIDKIFKISAILLIMLLLKNRWLKLR